MSKFACVMIVLTAFFFVGCGEDEVIQEEADVIVSELAELEEVAEAERDGADLIAQDETTVSVRFVESAPKDRFVFENRGSCLIGEATVEIDLAETAGKLIFDTTETGAGVEVFQPFEILEGDISLVSGSRVEDGDRMLTVQIFGLEEGGRAGFTIDVDDTLTDSDLGMIRVTESEMSGGRISMIHGEFGSATAVFDDVSQAVLALPCAGS